MRALAALEATRLEMIVGSHVASFGDCCYQTDAALQHVLKRPDGKPYHRESIARARRRLARDGFITSTRIFTNDKIPGAKYNGGRSTRGTTLKTFNWRRLAVRSPFSRRERRELRIKQAQAARAAGELAPARPRYSGVTSAVEPTFTPPLSALDSEYRAQIDATTRALERQWAAGESTGPVPVRSPAAGRGPPE